MEMDCGSLISFLYDDLCSVPCQGVLYLVRVYCFSIGQVTEFNYDSNFLGTQSGL